MSDTLAQKYLIELLMWNASNVHKQSSKVWQEKLVDPSWNSVRGMLSTSLLWRRFWCNRTQKSKNARLRQQCRSWNGFVRHAGTWLSRLPLTINWKIAGTSGWSVPISQSQTTVFVGQWMEWDSLPPCIHGKKILLNQQQKHKTNRRKFYICADGPHTHIISQWGPRQKQ